MRIVFDDEHLQVIHRSGNSAYSIATFNPKDEKANGRSFWGDVLHTKYGISCFGFVTKRPNWYPSRSMEAAAAAIAPLRNVPLISYGHSMGGYASLKYAKLLRVAGVVSSSPQTSINPADTGTDRRYAAYFDPTLHCGMGLDRDDLTGRIVIAYDPVFAEDSAHVRRIVALCAGAELIRLPHLKHRTVLALNPRLVLIPIFESILYEKSIQNLQTTANIIRKSEPNFIIYLSRQLIIQKHPITAIKILFRISNDARLSIKIEHDFYLARCYSMVNRVPEALYLMNGVVHANLRNRSYSAFLAHLCAKYPNVQAAPGEETRSLLQSLP